MKTRIFAILVTMLSVASSVRAASFYESISKREAGDLGVVFWLPVSLAVLAGIIIVISTTRSYTNESQPHR